MNIQKLRGVIFLWAGTFMFFCFLCDAAAQEDLSVLGWKIYSDKENALYREIAGEAYRYLDKREQRLSQISSRDEFFGYYADVRRRLAEAFGPLPEKTPINARITGTHEYEGILIEKIIFESHPGFYVTGCVFKLSGLEGRLPAVLYVCGHTSDGFRSETYQHFILNLALKGFLVFAVDPIGQGERIQYFDTEKGESFIGGPTKEHSYAGLQYLFLGRTMAMVRLWDCIRAVDYLCDRPDVDMGRIGVHGRSGGGTMSSFLGAMDDRIAASAPECYLTSFRRLFQSIGPQDAEQNLLEQISNGLDHGDFLVARGLKPTLVVVTTRDFFSIQGVRETVQSIKSIMPESSRNNLSIVEDDAPHQSTKRNREAVYDFFMKAFGMKGDASDIDINPLDPQILRVTPTGQTVTSGSKTIHDIICEDAAGIGEALVKNRTKNAGYSSRIQTAAKKLSGLRIPEKMDEPVFCGRHIRDGYVIEKYIIDGEGELPLPVLLFVPNGIRRCPALIYINPEGKSVDAGEGGEIESLIRMGYCVLAPDLPGYGELSVDTKSGDSVIGGVSYNIVFGAQLIGRSITGIQAGHIIRACRFLDSRNDVVRGKYVCISKGVAGPALMHAAAVEKSIGAVALDGTPLSWMSVVKNRIYDNAIGSTVVPSALTSYDLIDLQRVFSPRKLLVYKPVGGDAEPPEESEINRYERVIKSFYDSHEDRFTLIDAHDNRSFGSVLAGWLSKD